MGDQNDSNNYGGMFIGWKNGWDSNAPDFGHIPRNNAYIALVYDADTATTLVGVAALAASADIIINAVYEV